MGRVYEMVTHERRNSNDPINKRQDLTRQVIREMQIKAVGFFPTTVHPSVWTVSGWSLGLGKIGRDNRNQV